MSFTILAAAAIAASSPASNVADLRDRSREIAFCLVEKRPELAAHFISVSRGGPDEQRLTTVLTRDATAADCLGMNRKELDLTTLRGAIAEALYRREFPAAPAEADLKVVNPIASRAESTDFKLRYWFAQCLVNSSAGEIDGLLRSEPGSTAERSVVGTLASGFSACLPKENTVKFARPELRAYLSEALYRTATTLRDREICKGLSQNEASRQRRTCPAIPIGKGVLVTIHDYPQASLDRREDGTVTVQYSIGKDGIVEPGSCTVIVSSGHERLDSRTCEVTAHFRFRPALFQGQPAAEVRNQIVRWSLPQNW